MNDGQGDNTVLCADGTQPLVKVLEWLTVVK